MANISNAIGVISFHKDFISTERGEELMIKVFETLKPVYEYGLTVDYSRLEEDIDEMVVNSDNMISLNFYGTGRWSMGNTLSHFNSYLKESFSEMEFKELVNFVKETLKGGTDLFLLLEYDDIEQSDLETGSVEVCCSPDSETFYIVKDLDYLVLTSENLPEVFADNYFVVDKYNLLDSAISDSVLQEIKERFDKSKREETFDSFMDRLADEYIKAIKESYKTDLITNYGNDIELKGNTFEFGYTEVELKILEELEEV